MSKKKKRTQRKASEPEKPTELTEDQRWLREWAEQPLFGKGGKQIPTRVVRWSEADGLRIVATMFGGGEEKAKQEKKPARRRRPRRGGKRKPGR